MSFRIVLAAVTAWAMHSVLLVDGSTAFGRFFQRPSLVTPITIQPQEPQSAPSGGTTLGDTTITNPECSSSLLLENRHVQSFERNGFLVVRGLFSQEEIDDMTRAGNAIVELSAQDRYDTFSVVEKNLIYGTLQNFTHNVVREQQHQQDETNDKDKDNNSNENGNGNEDTVQQKQDMIIQTFRNVALRSKLPHICAQLMGLTTTTTKTNNNNEKYCLRCIRDVFLAKYISTGETCDWHVDDQSFWPESFLPSTPPKLPTQRHDSRPAGSESDSTTTDEEETAAGILDGINVWIALDDYQAEYGGAMILSRGSHVAPWRHEAYASIGQNRSTDGGYLTRRETVQYFNNPNHYGTCSLDMSNPSVRAQVERNKVQVADLRKGDVILATRLCFHRTARVTEAGLEYYTNQKKKEWEDDDEDNKNGKDLVAGVPLLLHRYSVRYVPGTARLPQGPSAEPSVLYNPENAGQSLNSVCGDDYFDNKEEEEGEQKQQQDSSTSSLFAVSRSFTKWIHSQTSTTMKNSCSSTKNNEKFCWYPKTWPAAEPNVDDKLNQIAQHAMPIVKVRLQEFHQEFATLLKEANVDIRNFRGRS